MELLPYGHYVAKVDAAHILSRLGKRPDGKYVEVTAITPTPLGEGKSTTTMGLVEGLGALGKKVIGAIRRPSGGPTFNIKGSAAGGGLAQCIPLADFSLGLTGDIDAITNAHNLAMVALTSRLQHEFNYSDAFLAKKNLKRLDIDPRNPAMGWCIDLAAQALRSIVIGLGGEMDGFLMQSGFQKCRFSGLTPNASVLVTTVRALKMHGGGPKVVPGAPLDQAYTERNVALVEKGLGNLVRHINTVKTAGIPCVVCINHFATDADEEIEAICEAARTGGARVAVSRHWARGGEGARELAEAVVDACGERPQFRFLYEEDTPLEERIRRIATQVYGAGEVSYAAAAREKMEAVSRDPELARLGTCMVKTHLSLTADPAIKGAPTGWTLPIRDILIYRGAGFCVPVAGDIKLMPGTASDAAFRHIDVDTQTGRVTGLFYRKTGSGRAPCCPRAWACPRGHAGGHVWLRVASLEVT